MILIPKDISIFKMLNYGFRFSGMMHYEGKTSSLIALVYHWIMNTCFGVLTVLEIILGNGKLIDKIEVLSCITGYIFTFPKLYTLCTRGKEIRQLFNRLEDVHIKISKDPGHQNNLSKTEHRGKIIVICFATFEVFSLIFIFLFQTIDVLFNDFKDRKFLVQIWIPWNTDEIWAYLLANAFIHIMAFTFCLAIVLFASAELTFTFQTSAYLKVLQSYLETRGPADRIIYQYHDTLIQIINDYNNIFSGAMYVEIVCASLWPSGIAMTLIRVNKYYWNYRIKEAMGKFAGDRFVTAVERQNLERSRLEGKNVKKNNFNHITADLLKACIGTVIFTITLSCGQEVNTQVERLHESSYMSKWYEETPKVRRDLLMLMIRTTKPTTVNYRLFVTFDRECLAKVLQGIYSFLMMIISFDTDS